MLRLTKTNLNPQGELIKDYSRLYNRDSMDTRIKNN